LPDNWSEHPQQYVGVLISLTSQSILLWRLAHGSRLDVHELRAHHQLTGESPLDNNFSGIIITVVLYTTEPVAMWLLVQCLYLCDAVPACHELYSGAPVNMWNVLRKVLMQTLFYEELLPFRWNRAIGTVLVGLLVWWFDWTLYIST
jgi:hypothetical protein